MEILNLNLSLCNYKRDYASNAIKHAKDAIAINDKNAKGYYRLYLAYKLNKDLDKAKEQIVEAIKLDPKNKVMRSEY